MNLRQLRYLVAVHDEHGMRAAARTLHVSQPLITRALRELERELGLELLYRSPTGVEVTPAGEELARRGRVILEHVAGAQDAMRGMADRRSTTLHVGLEAGVISAGGLLEPLLSAFRTSAPDVALEVHDLGFSDPATAILKGSVDVAVVRSPLSQAGVMVVPIACEPRLALVNSLHECGQEEVVDLEDILDYPTVPLLARPAFADFWELNTERGRPHRLDGLPPASTTSEAQAAIASRRVVVAACATVARTMPHPLVTGIEVRGLTPSVIAIAYRRDERRRIVGRFVAEAQAAAEREIGRLPFISRPDAA